MKMGLLEQGMEVWEWVNQQIETISARIMGSGWGGGGGGAIDKVHVHV